MIFPRRTSCKLARRRLLVTKHIVHKLKERCCGCVYNWTLEWWTLLTTFILVSVATNNRSNKDVQDNRGSIRFIPFLGNR